MRMLIFLSLVLVRVANPLPCHLDRECYWVPDPQTGLLVYVCSVPQVVCPR